MLKNEKGKKENKKQESSLVTKESICATCAVFSLLALLALCTKSLIFGDIGRTVHICLTGILGYFAYPVFVGAMYLSITGLIGKRLVRNRKIGVYLVLCLFFAGLIAQTAMTYSWTLDGYVKKCFLSGETFPDTTVCGAVGGLVVYAVAKFATKLGAVVFFSIASAFFGCLCYIVAKKPAKAKAVHVQEAQEAQVEVQTAEEQNGSYQTESIPTETAQDVYTTPNVQQRPVVALGEDTATTENITQAGNEEEAPYDSRAFLFGGTPAENYQRNLIFDPNARVNRRTVGGDIETSPQRESVYIPSYSDSYETTMNTQTGAPSVQVMGETGDNNAPSIYTINEQSDTSTPPTYTQETAYVDDSYGEQPSNEYSDDRARTESPVVEETVVDYGRGGMPDESVSREQTTDETQAPTREDGTYERHRYMDLFSPSNPRVFGDAGEAPNIGRGRDEEVPRGYEERETSRDDYEERGVDRGDTSRDTYVDNGYGDTANEREDHDGLHLLDDDEDDPYTLRTEEYEDDRRYGRDVAETRGRGRGDEMEESIPEEQTTETRGRGEEIPAQTVEAPKPTDPPKPVDPPKPRVIKPYKRVPLDDFDCRDIEPSANQEEVELTKANILATLEEFRITGATIASVTFGPTVTCYNLILPRNIAPRKVMALDESIAISLHSSGVNIYTNYEEGGVTIEVPNKERQFVQLGCMLSGDTFVNAKPSSLMFAMGKDVANRKVYGDITKMIHMLVAGSSGSGKSVFLGSLIISLIYKYSPEELRLILIDPKKTEFVLYNNLPHLMINEIITDAGKAVQSLNWAIGEMNRRYGLFEQMSRAGTYVVNLDQYNEQIEKAQRLPKIVIIIDELADLMLAAKKEMEDRIQNLTQKARAAGIHLIVATQRPSTDVITGVIKSNLATRIAFGVATDVDSRVILDQTGAQKLLGRGDSLYTMPGINVPVRVQSAFISPEDSQKVVNFIKNNNEAYYDEEATMYINSRGGNGGTPSDPFDTGSGGDNVDPVYIEALRYVILSNSASISMIQRKCSAGYNRAGKIIEWMEDMGYISPFDGAKARKVLITKEEFESKYGPLEK